MLKNKNLTFRYNPEVIFEFPDLVCQPKEILLFLGKSGIGWKHNFLSIGTRPLTEQLTITAAGFKDIDSYKSVTEKESKIYNV